jgi:lipopolysaccharide transport system ATP-binding protein
MNSAIAVENLSKRYQIGVNQATRYRTLRESISGGFVSLRERLRGANGASSSVRLSSGTHWALNDVSFDIQPGEVVGIIGRNGAGKSTLLKILSRITEPTSGRAQIRGRIGSLLEVGTGFHPELTGRENIFLNGSILGMSRREIGRKFDEIVAFSEVEKFLDTPVKRYSSGMFVRLAFSVAAHLEPEILLVDEVLAVGDAQFQKKCLGKMDHIAQGGRTVLFVSHQMSSVQRLCRQCLLLDKGRLKSFGAKDEIVAQYLSEDCDQNQPGDWIDLGGAARRGTQEARFTGMRFRCPDPRITDHPFPDGPFEIQLSIESDAPRQLTSLAVTFYDRYGTKLVNADTMSLGETIWLDQGTSDFIVRIDALHLNPDTYILGLWMAINDSEYDHIHDAARIEVVDPPFSSFGNRPGSDGRVTCRFSVEKSRRPSSLEPAFSNSSAVPSDSAASGATPRASAEHATPR